MKIIYILGGLLRKNRDGNYGSDKLSYLRILAGYHLYSELSNKNKVELIVSGSKGIYRDIPGVPPVAKVMKQELIELGVSGKEIKIDKNDFTYNELLWLTKFISKGMAETFIISNAYHLPRIKVMINFIQELKKLKNVKLIPAEKVVIRHNKKIKSKIEKIYRSSKMKKIIDLEKRGIESLKNGGYEFKK